MEGVAEACRSNEGGGVNIGEGETEHVGEGETEHVVK
jgi:hypothetical protein